MIVSLIAAVAANQVIGKDNDLVWNLPVDMQFFKETTKGHVVIMGRRNWESIPPKWRPLPGRQNVVVTRQLEFSAEGCLVVHSIDQALELARGLGEKEAFIIGGGQIYAEALRANLVDRMYLTHLDAAFKGDTLFPSFDPSEWTKTVLGSHPRDERHSCGFVFNCFDKIKNTR